MRSLAAIALGALVLSGAAAHAQQGPVLFALEERGWMPGWNAAAIHAQITNGLRQQAQAQGRRVYDVREAQAQQNRAPEPCNAWCRSALAGAIGATTIVECAARHGDETILACTAREPKSLLPFEGYGIPMRHGGAVPWDLPVRLWARVARARQGDGAWREWLHLRTGLTTSELRVDGEVVCQHECSVLVPHGRHTIDASAPPFNTDQRIVDFFREETVDFALGARTALLHVTTRRGATIRVEGITLRAHGPEATVSVRVFEGERQVTVEDPCHYPESWPVQVAGGSTVKVAIDPTPRMGRARLVAKDEDGEELDATATIDGDEQLDLPFEGELPVCAHVRVAAPFHDEDTFTRTGPPDVVWEPDIELDENRERDRMRLARLPYGLSLRAGVAGTTVTELSLSNFSGGDLLFTSLGLTARSLARESGEREGAIGASGEVWLGAQFVGAFLRTQLLYLPEHGMPGFGDGAREAGAVPVAWTFGGGAAGFVRLGPTVLGIATGYDFVPGRLEGGPSVQAFLTY